jgi:CTP:molybdopterin cytidylyltransferase MocA
MPPQVSAIVLAAGSSRRMGTAKQLLSLGPKTVIHHCLDSVAASGIKDIVVVLGAAHDDIEAAICGLTVRTVVNNDAQSDMAGSVRTGLKAVDPAATAVLICLSDHPLVSAGTIAAIVGIHREHADGIIIPRYKGRRGHPTLFPRTAIEDVFRGATLRDVITAHAGRISLVDVDDEGVVLDMDTPEDYARFKRHFS